MTKSFIANPANPVIVSSPVIGELVPAKQTHPSAALALRNHWPEYLMESAELGLFMISACVVTAVLEHPASPLHRVLPNPFTRRVITGVAMGLTLLALIHSKWGKRSGAHMNPAFTLMFLRLGKVEAWDAAWYARNSPRFHGGAFDLVRARANGSRGLESFEDFAIHALLRGQSGGCLHHLRGAVLGNEHESGPDTRLGAPGAHVSRTLDLFHRSAAGHAGRGRALPSCRFRAVRVLRQVSSRE